MERMTEELKLTDEQKPKVKTVLEASQEKAPELFTDRSVREKSDGKKLQAHGRGKKKLKRSSPPTILEA